MKKLAKDMLTLKREKALGMVGKKIEVQIANKALSINEDTHTAIFVMSTEAIDRHGDIVDQDSWILDYFNENPYFALQHRSDNFPLGRWLRVWFEADPNNEGRMRMLGEAYFAVDIDEDAARAWAHVKDGNMNMVSVGFIPHRVDYDENRDAFILFDCELIECSLVGIGSNRQALIKTTPDDGVEEARNAAIEARKAIDSFIKKSNNTKVIAHLVAREALNKAIRNLHI